ncbi:MAG: hypothetical protein WC656_01755 [Sulfurimonas sp.]|jgi:hypothetical protein
MKTILLRVEDSGLEVILSIINNLRSGIIRDYAIEDDIDTSIEKISNDNEDHVDLLQNMSAEDKKIASENM